jgi:hypothetical protein
MFVLNVLRGESRPNNEAKFADAESLKGVLRKGFPNRTFNMPGTAAHWAAALLAEAISAESSASAHFTSVLFTDGFGGAM